ncbi:hypothetical protein ACH50O_23025 (plasmid) [Methylomonas sp. 2BW1-5-20]|uniref:hypothetical protein n=1 Tax=Methylomonas sp. 2BW1-5-20 TaxID=3376686 RepID=UPI004052047D
MRLLLCLLLATGTAYAQSIPETTLEEMRAKHLSPQQLQAIRAIGGNVLQAKQTAQVDPADKALLMQLQSAVYKLIAAENLTNPAGLNAISKNGAAIPAVNTQQTANDAARKSAETAAWEIIGNLHQDSSQLQSTSKSAAKRVIHSAGKPIGEQRGRQYELWANQLEAIINNKNPDRITELLIFGKQIQTQPSGVSPTAIDRGPPNFQSRPWRDQSVQTVATHPEKHKIKH